MQTAQNVKELILPATTAFWSFIQIFLICELGERLTGQFDEIATEIFRSNWYTFPMDVKKALPLFIKGAQIPVVLNGLGHILCTREAFKNASFFDFPKAHIEIKQFIDFVPLFQQVTTKGYTYFTMLRKV